MKTVFKFPLCSLDDIRDNIVVTMPGKATILSVGIQKGVLCMWALVDPVSKPAERRFRIAGTGHPLGSETMVFLGTTSMMGGDLIWHLFEVLAPAS